MQQVRVSRNLVPCSPKR